MADVTLFTQGRIDGFDTKNRFVMAPMTRSRALPGGVPSELAIEYYTQRASAGLIITEGVAPCAAGLGYARTPTAETPEQMAAWKEAQFKLLDWCVSYPLFIKKFTFARQDSVDWGYDLKSTLILSPQINELTKIGK